MNDRSDDPAVTQASKESSLLAHLFELRDRLLRMFLSVLVVFLCLFPFANDIYTFLAGPLTQHLPEGSSMIAIEVASPFLIPFKLVLLLSVVLAIPFILYQLWAFVAPGLYQNEKRLALPLLVSSTLLFYAGMAFAYYVVFPLVFGFFTSTTPTGVAVMTDIGRYLDFVIMLFIAFGVAFEVPVATILLVAAGLTTPAALARKRPYVVVGAFIIGMVLTPPDVISQTLLAVPMWLLFEAGLVLSRMMVRRKEREEAEEDEASASDERAAQDVDEPGTQKAAGSGDEYRPLTPEEMERELDAIESTETRPPSDGAADDQAGRTP